MSLMTAGPLESIGSTLELEGRAAAQLLHTGWRPACVALCAGGRAKLTTRGAAITVEDIRRTRMHKLLIGLGGAASVMFAAAPAHAQGTVKIGLPLTYSGQFADAATQMDNGIKLYMKQKGDT